MSSALEQRGIELARKQSVETVRQHFEEIRDELVSCRLLEGDVYRVERDSGACWTLPPEFFFKGALTPEQVDFLEKFLNP